MNLDVSLVFTANETGGCRAPAPARYISCMQSSTIPCTDLVPPPAELSSPLTFSHPADVSYPSLSQTVRSDSLLSEISEDPLSPAALFLASFSPPHGNAISAIHHLPKPDQFELSKSPAAQSLSSYASIPSTTPVDLVESVGYRLGSFVGSGAFAQVYLATSSATEAVVAVKIINRSKMAQVSRSALRCLENEENIWSSLNHEHILPLFSCRHLPDTTLFFMLYCPEGDLLEILSKERARGRRGLEHDVVRTLFLQITRGVAYLHDTMKIVHRDLKLENILIDDSGAPRIADFGLAHRMDAISMLEDGESKDEALSTTHSPTLHLSLRRTHPPPRVRHASFVQSRSSSPDPEDESHMCGTLLYASPEILRPSFARREIRPAQDIWALGCILHALLTGLLPFNDSYEPRLQMKIMNGTWEQDSTASPEDKAFLRGCLNTSADDRWPISRVIENAHQVGTTRYQQLHCDYLVGRASSSSRSPSRLRRAAVCTELDESDMTSRITRDWSRSKSSTKSTDLMHSSVRSPRAFQNSPFLTELEKMAHLPRRSFRALSSESRTASEDVIGTPPDGDDLLLFGSRGRRQSFSSGYGGAVWVRSPSSSRRKDAVGESRSRSRGRAPYKLDHRSREALDREETDGSSIAEARVFFDSTPPLLNPTSELGTTGHSGANRVVGLGHFMEDL